MHEPPIFKTRAECPICRASAHHVLWRGDFADPKIHGWLKRCAYSGEWARALDGHHFELARCASCAVKYHRHVLSDAGMALLYGQWADADQAARFEQAHVRETCDLRMAGRQMVKLLLRLDHLAATRGQPVRLLDFGSGEGKLLALARLLGMEPVGVEISDARSADARQQGLRIYCGLDALEQAGEPPFDALVLNQVLEHLPDPLALLKALRLRLAPGAVLYAAVPDTTRLGIPTDFASFHKLHPLEHLNAFTPQTLRDLAGRAGFRPVKRPTAFVTTEARLALRSALNWVWQPRNTDVFFRLQADP